MTLILFLTFFSPGSGKSCVWSPWLNNFPQCLENPNETDLEWNMGPAFATLSSIDLQGRALVQVIYEIKWFTPR